MLRIPVTMTAGERKLLARAKGARKKAVAPHTGFKVGAALLARSGKIYTGANVESDIPSLSICADRAALIGALNAGERKFSAIAITTETRKPYPCGVCAQMLLEFCGSELKIIAANSKTTYPARRLGEFLPFPYKMER